jgi:MtrB/PioB family decaheme-associated outer membrane protein
MKRMIYIPFTLLIATPSFAADDLHGDITLGLRTTHFASDQKSAKFDEYRDMSNGLFGDVNLLLDREDYYLGLSIENPTLDDESYELRGGQFGLGKARIYYDKLDHQLSRNALTPLGGVGSNVLTVPDPIPPVSGWTPIDYEVERKAFGAEFTIDSQENPLYFKASMEQQRQEGTMPWGATLFSGFEVPMPVDYTTNNFLIESGYRNEKTTAVLTASYSDFENDDDLLSVVDGPDIEEYSTAADNYSYNFGGRLVQRLPNESVLALKASYTRNISEADWDEYTQITSPSGDDDFDGEVEYIRGSAALTSKWSPKFDTRLFYSYVDRNNDSEKITAVDFDGTRSNTLFEYDKNEAGLDANYRLNRTNKLTGGYEFSHVNRNREDADTTTDNLVFAQLKNTSLDWMSTKIRLEYMNRSSDSNYDAAYLADDHQNQFFTPYDYASKDRYKGKVAFDFYPTESVVLGLSYALVYDDYDATQLGMQDEQRHEIYVDVSALLPAKIRLNTFAGYEYTKSNFDSRNYTNSDNEDPNGPTTSSNYNWSQETTYDFVVIGSTLTVPVIPPLDLVFSADHQFVDGNIDFARPAIAGDALEDVTDADDYYKTQIGAKGIYQFSDAWTVTLGYLYEKSDLDEWKYTNYELTTSSFDLSGAGLDSDYETHQFYMTTTFSF